MTIATKPQPATEIIIIDPEQYGIEKSKAKDLIGNLTQIVSERSVLESQYNEIITLDIEDNETSKKARELRLKIRDNRTKGIDLWHKTTKDYYLKAGQFVDAVKRKESTINERMEENLESIEKHSENKEKEILATLQIARLEEVAKYGVDGTHMPLSQMSDDVWSNYLTGAKLAYEAKKEAELKSEQERIAKEKAEAEERERIRIENERLKKEAEAREKEIAKQRAEAEKEKKIAEEKARKEREENEAKLKAEREAREKVERELKAKKDAEEKAIRDEQKRIQDEAKAKKAEERRLAKAGDSEILKKYIQSLDFDYTVNEEKLSEEGKGVYEEINYKYESFKKWALAQIETL